ncbi:YcnI family protein [Streptomyces sp. NRRL S-87]|uniref:YcnI family copper-binding membrane protein n=1 Tax=Streptomyces sp. NRRL S-87 TaxID=1463920 RepID=UPI0004C08ACB|nr:YcnI family protein [Streptomyces sp. NRRL S-87]
MKTSRVSVVAALAAGSVLLLSGPAFAHVSVQPGTAEKGSYATINFKVPNERDNASTVKLEVTFPADHPLASVMPQDVPGWQVQVTKSKLAKPLTLHGKQIDEAVTKVTWTGGKITTGRFQQFPLSVGQLPEDADQLVFKAVQTYDDNEVVRWIEEAKEGAAEPQNPAPVLKLATGTGEGHHGGTTGGKDDAKHTDAHDESGEDEHTGAASTTDTTARALGIAGILVGVVGVAFGVLARRRTS